MRKKIVHYTLSVAIDDKTTKFPVSVSELDNVNVVGVFVTMQDANSTKKDRFCKDLLSLEKQLSSFVRLEGEDNCDDKLLHVPFNSLSVDNKNIPYIPVNLGKLGLSQCEITIGNYTATDNGKVCVFTFITQ